MSVLSNMKTECQMIISFTLATKIERTLCSWKRDPRGFVFLIYPYLLASMLSRAEAVYIKVNWNFWMPSFWAWKKKTLVSIPAVDIYVGSYKISKWMLNPMLFHYMLHLFSLNCWESSWSFFPWALQTILH